MNPEVDTYFLEGCGRCALAGTPGCKVHRWTTGMQALRKILLDTELTEERKWGMPCYTLKGKNVIMLVAFKQFAALSFLNGALLKDPLSLLSAPGKHSQAVRTFRFTSLKDIRENTPVLKTYIQEAIALEKKGKKIIFKKAADIAYPEELVQQFLRHPRLKNAFHLLTPGRQRGYLLFFTSAKQSATRTARIEKYHKWIMEGKGLHD